MGFKSVFKFLVEVFPQVDIRVLKAAAIEHSKDADAAAEFIISEVLPSIPSPLEAPYNLMDDWDVKQPSIYNPFNTPSSSDNHNAEHLSTRGVEIKEPNILLKHQEAVEVANPGPSSKLGSEEREYHEDTDHTSSGPYIYSTCLDDALTDSSLSTVRGRNNLDQQFFDTGKHQEINITFGSHQGSHTASSSMIQGDIVVSDHFDDAPRANIQDLNEPVTYDSDSTIYRDSLQDQSRFEDNPLEAEKVPTSFLLDSSSVYEETLDFASKGDIEASISECERPEWSGLLENVSKEVVFDSEVVDVEDKSSSTTIVTQSGQICRIDILEDAISDAKNNKKTLFSAMESVINMMREVELQEKKVEQAKEEAEREGLYILKKVEDHRQMLQLAKEANEMLVGEVYGEKAILATEAQELQSRLLNLSDERDVSLNILDEMRLSLEARLAVAEKVMKAAEQEKLEKEEHAKKSLMEVELEMDKVVQESKRLQQEAEENSKLREFLMDRGQVVDTLQGEIAVICYDVKLLKEKFDECAPLSESLSSSQTSCILASSGSSGKNLAFDQVLEQNESSTTPIRTSPAPSIDGKSPKSSPEGKEIRDDRKVLLDDGWDLFDDATELSNRTP